MSCASASGYKSVAHYLVLTKLQEAAAAGGDKAVQATAAAAEAEAIPAEQPDSAPVTRQRKSPAAKPAGAESLLHIG
jgi:hypothetical protein